MQTDSGQSPTPAEYTPPKAALIVPPMTLGQILVRFVVVAVAIVLALFVALVVGVLSGLIPFEC